MSLTELFRTAEAVDEDRFPTRIRKYAPTREEIEGIEDIKQLEDMLADAEDVEIEIETQLDYFLTDDDLKHRRVGALIFWKIAIKRIRSRLNKVDPSRVRLYRRER